MAFNTTTSQLLGGFAVVLATIAIRFFYQGYVHRRAVRSLITQGLPVLPHSIFFGHLPVFADFAKKHPPDVNVYVFHTWLMENCETFFPGYDCLPPVVYLDLWPISTSLALVTDPVAAAQFTMVKSEPKIAVFRKFIWPMTKCLDILTTDGQIWKTWRSRFNPGFSQRNLTAFMPEIIEEVSVFVDRLKKQAVASKGDGNGWGPVFQLEKMTTDLTFDVICRATLDIRLHSQSDQPQSPLKSALLDQSRLMGLMENAARGIFVGRWPWHHAAIARNNRTMHDFLLPLIQERLHAGPEKTAQKTTIVDLAIKHIDTDASAGSEEPTTEFVDRLIANLKIFLFAGHDTTAATICFMTKLLQDNPESLAKLRAEHDAVLGADPTQATQALIASPHLLHALPYTLSVIKETLRLHPLAATVRESHPGYYMSGAADPTVQFPMERFGLWMSPPALQRHPKYWPRPHDFVPERWTVAEGDPLYPATPNTWVPFSLGPRNCIGMELAYMELKLVLVMTARTLDIEEAWSEWDILKGAKATPSHAVDGERLYGIGTGLVHPKDGMPVHVRLRQ
ncbi:hypothetical protein PG989_007138 [Apiospora arundinis]|uniref:Vera protein n=1 Tax=Apiospora arundinis TaxID=335852 RepID=A0ABR2I9R0_9PEZI